MKTSIKFIIILLCSLIIAIIAFFIWYSDTGKENQYYIKEANMYIKTYPSREAVIIAFSDNVMGDFSDSLDYVKVYKGNDYGTGILLDPNEKMVIHILGNSLKERHWQKYKQGDKEISSNDTVYFEKKEDGGYLLKYPYIEISFELVGSSEKVLSKNRDNIYYTEIKPID
ncbi:hypothetical protein [uncultured Dysgonomonas sp.]|uniref:Uncharacterized protein n=1 Tax=uncultured Dysgonomonas sp. TaxID=206096 RepID=A0A212JNW2_9BACT|nr:hypothetical protein [uncultured Dysgonomonas sp.]SBW01088.1 exported hypothetical protein [uncultured Dysgonomonas sp.]